MDVVATQAKYLPDLPVAREMIVVFHLVLMKCCSLVSRLPRTN